MCRVGGCGALRSSNLDRVTPLSPLSECPGRGGSWAGNALSADVRSLPRSDTQQPAPRWPSMHSTRTRARGPHGGQRPVERPTSLPSHSVLPRGSGPSQTSRFLQASDRQASGFTPAQYSRAAHCPPMHPPTPPGPPHVTHTTARSHLSGPRRRTSGPEEGIKGSPPHAPRPPCWQLSKTAPQGSCALCSTPAFPQRGHSPSRSDGCSCTDGTSLLSGA